MAKQRPWKKWNPIDDATPVKSWNAIDSEVEVADPTTKIADKTFPILTYQNFPTKERGYSTEFVEGTYPLQFKSKPKQQLSDSLFKRTEQPFNIKDVIVPAENTSPKESTVTNIKDVIQKQFAKEKQQIFDDILKRSAEEDKLTNVFLGKAKPTKETLILGNQKANELNKKITPIVEQLNSINTEYQDAVKKKDEERINVLANQYNKILSDNKKTFDNYKELSDFNEKSLNTLIGKDIEGLKKLGFTEEEARFDATRRLFDMPTKRREVYNKYSELQEELKNTDPNDKIKRQEILKQIGEVEKEIALSGVQKYSQGISSLLGLQDLVTTQIPEGAEFLLGLIENKLAGRETPSVIRKALQRYVTKKKAEREEYKPQNEKMYSLGNAVGTGVLSYITGGAGGLTAKALGLGAKGTLAMAGITATANSFVLEGANAYSIAKDYGLSDNEALTEGIIVGLVNAPMDAYPVIGAMKKFGIGVNSVKKEIMDTIFKKGLAQKIERIAVESIKQGIASEGPQEAMQEIMPLIRETLYKRANDRPRFMDWWSRVGESYFAGVIVGGLFGGGGATIQQLRETQRGKIFDKAIEEDLKKKTLDKELIDKVVLQKLKPKIDETTSDESIGKNVVIEKPKEIIPEAEEQTADLPSLEELFGKRERRPETEQDIIQRESQAPEDRNVRPSPLALDNNLRRLLNQRIVEEEEKQKNIEEARLTKQQKKQREIEHAELNKIRRGLRNAKQKQQLFDDSVFKSQPFTIPEVQQEYENLFKETLTYNQKLRERKKEGLQTAPKVELRKPEDVLFEKPESITPEKLAEQIKPTKETEKYGTLQERRIKVTEKIEPEIKGPGKEEIPQGIKEEIKPIFRSAAIRWEGKVYEGNTHGEIADKIGVSIESEEIPFEDYGFVTKGGKFVTEEEAEKLVGEVGLTAEDLAEEGYLKPESVLKKDNELQLEIMQRAGIPEEEMSDYALSSIADGRILRGYINEIKSGDIDVDEAVNRVKRDYEKMKSGEKEGKFIEPTGKVKVFRGTEGATKSKGLKVLGEGKYWFANKESAQRYGDSVEESEVDTNELLQISGDNYNEIFKEAGITQDEINEISSKTSGSKLSKIGKKLENYAKGRGYKGIYASDNVKDINNKLHILIGMEKGDGTQAVLFAEPTVPDSRADLISKLEGKRKELERDYGSLEDLSKTELKNLVKREETSEKEVSVGEAITIKRSFDNFRETNAPKVEWVDDFGRERKSYDPDSQIRKEHMFKSDETGRLVRWGIELSDGRKVSVDGAIRITRPNDYKKVEGTSGLKAKQNKLYDLLTESEKDNLLKDAYDSLGDKITDTNSFQVQSILKEEGHPFAEVQSFAEKLGQMKSGDIKPPQVKVDTKVEKQPYEMTREEFEKSEAPHTFGDWYATPDGKMGQMRGGGGLGSDRVRLYDVNGKFIGYYNRSELKFIQKNKFQSESSEYADKWLEEVSSKVKKLKEENSKILLGRQIYDKFKNNITTERFLEKQKNGEIISDKDYQKALQIEKEIEATKNTELKVPENKKHKEVVEQALKEGKTVPEEVLKDYPDLVKETAKPIEEQIKPEIDNNKESAFRMFRDKKKDNEILSALNMSPREIFKVREWRKEYNQKSMPEGTKEKLEELNKKRKEIQSLMEQTKDNLQFQKLAKEDRGLIDEINQLENKYGIGERDKYGKKTIKEIVDVVIKDYVDEPGFIAVQFLYPQSRAQAQKKLENAGYVTKKLDDNYLRISKLPEAKPTKEVKPEVGKPAEETKPEKQPYEATPQETNIAEVKNVPMKDISLDEGRFQNRPEPYSEETASSIEQNFKPASFKPITVWEDPKDGKTYVLAGHSRYEGMRRRGAKEIPAQYFEGSEEEAINYARIESNREATAEDIIADIRAYKQAKEQGYSKSRLIELFKKESRVNTLQKFSNLDENGEFLRALNSDAAKSFPYLERNSSWIGELRGIYPQLTDAHERELFDFLYRSKQKNQFILRDDLFNKVEDRVMDLSFKPEQNLALEKLEGLGSRARSDTRDIQLKIDKLRARNRELNNLSKGAPETQKKIFQDEMLKNTEEIRKLEDNIGEIINAQIDIFGQLEEVAKNEGINEEAIQEIITGTDPAELQELAEDIESKGKSEESLSDEEIEEAIRQADEVINPPVEETTRLFDREKLIDDKKISPEVRQELDATEKMLQIISGINDEWERNRKIEDMVYPFAGSNLAAHRQRLLSVIKGENIPKAKSGINALKKEYENYVNKLRGQSEQKLYQKIKPESNIPDKLVIDGIERPTRDNKGNLIHPTTKGIENFWRNFKDSKVVDEQGRPILIYSGHSSTPLYRNYDPKKATAGGFYASEDPDVASNYAMGKFGIKEGFESGSQYRIKGKNGEYNKKLWQIELTEEQKKKLDEIAESKNEYDEYNYKINEMMDWAKSSKDYEPLARRILTRGKYDLQSIYDYNEHMGYNIAYPEPEKGEYKPLFLRQRKNDTEEIMDALGIEWQSYDWAQPGVLPVYLNITNPLDADKPFPQALLNELKDRGKYERTKSMDEISYTTWTKDYPLKEWVKDIESGEEGWTTQVPKKALPILKKYGYDGIKERGMKGFAKELPRDQRQINWIAFDAEQIKSAIANKGTFDINNPQMLRQDLLDRNELQQLQDRKRHLELVIEEAGKKGDTQIVSKARQELGEVNSKLSRKRDKTSQFDIFGDVQDQQELFQKEHTRFYRNFEKLSEKEKIKFLNQIWKMLASNWGVEFKDLSKEQAAGITHLLRKVIELDPNTANFTTLWEELFHQSMIALAKPYAARNMLRRTGWNGKGEIWDVVGNKSLRDAHEKLAKDFIKWVESSKEPQTNIEKVFAQLKELWNKIAAFLYQIGFRTHAGYFEMLYSGKLKASAEGIDVEGLAQSLAQEYNRDENFKRWFKGSKIINSDGTPKIVYHGTSETGFDKFKAKAKYNTSQLGYWFTEKPEVANIFAYQKYADGGEGVYPVYLSLKNPKIYDGWKNLKDAWQEIQVRSFDIAVKRLGNKLRNQGYDGIILKNSKTDTDITRDDYVVFNPSQIKSIFNRGTFSPDDPNILHASFSPMWYSKLERVIDNKLQNKGFTYPSVTALLKNNGVKEEEIKWLDIDGFFKNNPNPTKQQLQEWIKGNQIEVKEVNKGQEKIPIRFSSLYDMPDDVRNYVERYLDKPYDNFESDVNNVGYEAHYDNSGEIKYLTKEGETANFDNTKYSQYQIPGGTNYREILFTLPAKKRFSKGKLRVEEDENNVSSREIYRVVDEEGNVIGVYSKRKFAQEVIDMFGDTPVELDSDLQPAFITSHWDEPNVIAHARINDRTLPDERKILFVEEIQSDWHQKGRKEGYADSEKLQGLKKQLNEAMEEYNKLDFANLSLTQLWNAPESVKVNRLKEEIFDLEKNVPDAPFKKDFHEMVFKRLLRLASEGGYDGISWTTAQQQVDRWEDALRKSVDTIHWQRANKESVIINGIKDNKNVFKETIPLEGKVTISGKDVTLDELIGKSLANQIRESKERAGKFEGNNLTIGGEQFRILYDQEIPKFLNQYGKKWGARISDIIINEEKIERVEVEETGESIGNKMLFGVYVNGDLRQSFPNYADAEYYANHIKKGTGLTIPYFPITDEMRRSVLFEGQALFQIIGEKGAANLDRAEEATTRLDNLNVAKEMETSGKDAKTIRLATGWERGAENKWKYEIPDGKLKYDKVKELIEKGKAENEPFDFYNVTTLDEIFTSKNLFNAYPELKHIKVVLNKNQNKLNMKGAYSPELKTITLSNIEYDGKYFMNAYDVENVLLHEIQHAIQYIEGFARGTSLTEIKQKMYSDYSVLMRRASKISNLFQKSKNTETSKKFDKIADDYVDNKITDKEFNKALGERNSTPEFQEFKKENDKFKEETGYDYRTFMAHFPNANDYISEEQSQEQYKKSAGEVESRNVQRRNLITKTKRKERLLSETEDVAREDQIILMEGLGVSEARDYGEMPEEFNPEEIFNQLMSEEGIKTKKDLYQALKEKIEKLIDPELLEAMRLKGTEEEWKISPETKDKLNNLLEFAIAKQELEAREGKHVKGTKLPIDILTFDVETAPHRDKYEIVGYKIEIDTESKIFYKGREVYPETAYNMGRIIGDIPKMVEIWDTKEKQFGEGGKYVPSKELERKTFEFPAWIASISKGNTISAESFARQRGFPSAFAHSPKDLFLRKATKEEIENVGEKWNEAWDKPREEEQSLYQRLPGSEETTVDLANALGDDAKEISNRVINKFRDIKAARKLGYNLTGKAKTLYNELLTAPVYFFDKHPELQRIWTLTDRYYVRNINEETAILTEDVWKKGKPFRKLEDLDKKSLLEAFKLHEDEQYEREIHGLEPRPLTFDKFIDKYKLSEKTANFIKEVYLPLINKTLDYYSEVDEYILFKSKTNPFDTAEEFIKAHPDAKEVYETELSRIKKDDKDRERKAMDRAWVNNPKLKIEIAKDLVFEKYEPFRDKVYLPTSRFGRKYFIKATEITDPTLAAISRQILPRTFFNTSDSAYEIDLLRDKLEGRGYIVEYGKWDEIKPALLENEITEEDLLDLAVLSGIKTDNETLNKLVKNIIGKGFKRHFIPKRYVPGFQYNNENFEQTIYNLINGVTNYKNRTIGQNELSDYIADLTKRHLLRPGTGEKDYIDKLRDNLDSYDYDFTRALRAVSSIWYLSFRLAYLGQQAIQPFSTLLPLLPVIEYELKLPKGTAEKVFGEAIIKAHAYYVWKLIDKASRLLGRGSIENAYGLDKDFLVLLRKLDRQGVAKPLRSFESFGGIVDPKRAYNLNPISESLSILGKIVGLPGIAVEDFTRVIGIRALYLMGKKAGLKGVRLEDFISDNIAKSYGAASGELSKPPGYTVKGETVAAKLWRSIARMYLTFKNFGFINYGQWGKVWRALKNDDLSRPIFYKLASTLGIGGFKYSMWLSSIMGAIRILFSLFDYPEPPEEKIKEIVKSIDEVVPGLGSAIEKGLLSTALGLDLSALFSQQAPFFTEEMAFKGGDISETVGGAPYAVARDVYYGIKHKDISRGLPTGIRNWIKADKMKEEGIKWGSRTLIGPKDITEKDVISKKMGFTTEKIAGAYETEKIRSFKSTETGDNIRELIEDKWLPLIKEGKPYRVRNEIRELFNKIKGENLFTENQKKDITNERKFTTLYILPRVKDEKQREIIKSLYGNSKFGGPTGRTKRLGRRLIR